MHSCPEPECSYTYSDRKSNGFAHHTINEHHDKYWILQKNTEKVLFTVRRETPTSFLQCPSCTYSTKNFRNLSKHLKRRHVLGAFATTTQLKRVQATPPPSNGVKVEPKDEVKEVITIFR
ncbi:hypothetical protein GALMADRAFT_877414 [Galerina marginata CBS 339.88]|uniref:C2H2-type domain-containing protein n=1 Tax=Galerina marginata (strain CBS 339.88) TaxID=685588 RepID=A0A067TJ70_GALM3|nr:hypothetical protein GALMADRAFT_877414 [Galerina marginata CBS 339.88]